MTSTNFPLFFNLYQETENFPFLNDSDIMELAESIKTMDREGDEILLALIRNYQLEIEKKNYNDLPFNVKTIKNGYKFTMNKLPPRLILILKSFVELHQKKILEEKQRNNFFQPT